MSKNITGAEYSLSKIFSSDFDYEIPPYQRPYAWTPEEAGELFDDLNDFYHYEKEESYFLGSIVLIKQENKPHSQVIDGQQRLTTLTILIAALTSLIDDKEAKDECFSYIQEPGKRLQGIPAKPRLALRQRDRTFFATTVQALEFENLANIDTAQLENESQVNIQLNALLLQKKLQQTFSNTETLINFGVFLMTRCFLVAVTSPSQQSAFRVFSVLNNRGMDLLPSDLIKADAIGKIIESKRDIFNDKWEEIEVNTGRSGLNDLLTYIRMIYAKTKAKRVLLEEFKEHVQSKINDPEILIDKVISPYADAYLIVRDSNYVASTNAENVNQILYWLNRIDNSDWQPVAIQFLAKFGSNSSAFLDFMFRLERLAAKLHICSANINERIDRYAKVLTELETSSRPSIESVNLSIQEANDFIKEIDGNIYYLTARRRNYIILRVDSFLTDKAAKYDHSILTIEHVLPQTVEDGSEWQANWPDEEQREIWTHRLANLVPLTQRRNSQASNFDFSRKKQAYFVGSSGVSSYILTTQVLNESEWIPSVLERRQLNLVELCKENWKLDVIFS
ncbi:conserved hypothetical protein [Pectobacterium atrosepticum SCRI1043]|uniref:DUF262 domain-containing protein n=1 Tax=Pectobacterium atrosepticum (strain SCRI 1043 / ATCC BAA-672) TaxID=218491 RepID=Q6D0Y9_PECAS|nr:DUF262 domain-containing protein [Pectobacterium atrosepticum]GKV86800.1 hypothetical protein PEC301296_31110 [Pectobacterium carotovorum subsp. carotovorum]AIA72446.1 hypothetical protein EV46_18165 [Pectobacterium atrosepticum]AIK15428.1 hypothetical protein GZ59_36880 [Pectobacterium atrosepticum]ATY92181.1 DUF262 domain-containing protein [Pectobacterium atrosepticum]KFX14540.1 hypothetical protein JV34_11980 [Pectobacterium atrosepticum]